jgi:hypothetical protein
MLLVRVDAAPMKVLVATERSLMLAGVFWKCLKE